MGWKKGYCTKKKIEVTVMGFVFLLEVKGTMYLGKLSKLIISMFACADPECSERFRCDPEVFSLF